MIAWYGGLFVLDSPFCIFYHAIFDQTIEEIEDCCQEWETDDIDDIVCEPTEFQPYLRIDRHIGNEEGRNVETGSDIWIEQRSVHDIFEWFFVCRFVVDASGVMQCYID